jgi:DtxR family Mn-dependent transcriptional regulator
MHTETAAIQDYLKAIYQLGGGATHVPTTALAQRLDVRPASVSGMVRRLDELGLVLHARYRGVRLTRKGTRQAVEVIRHHRLLELYLAQVVGLPLEKVHAEAEALEHVISEDLESRLDDLLGHPTEDPHGHPIPTRTLTLSETDYPLLSELGVGSSVVVRRVSDRDPELLRHLHELGLRPGARVEIVEHIAYGGGLRAMVDGSERVIGRQAAEAVGVSA